MSVSSWEADPALRFGKGPDRKRESAKVSECAKGGRNKHGDHPLARAPEERGHTPWAAWPSRSPPLARRHLSPEPAAEAAGNPAAAAAAGAAAAAAAAAAAGGDDGHGIVVGKHPAAILLHDRAAAHAHGPAKQPPIQMAARGEADVPVVVA